MLFFFSLPILISENTNSTDKTCHIHEQIHTHTYILRPQTNTLDQNFKKKYFEQSKTIYTPFPQHYSNTIETMTSLLLQYSAIEFRL